MIKVLIQGIAGSMGKEVCKLIEADHELQVIGGIDKNCDCKQSPPIFSSIFEIDEFPDVIIDFSSPELTINSLDFAVAHHIPMVIATTGLSDLQISKIKEASQSIPIFQSPNFAYEIQLMANIVSQLATYLPNSDIEIVETHHRRKKDAPSGTALFLADSINQATHQKYYYEHDRLHKKVKRYNNEIGFSSIRGGNIVGEHTVLFFGENECLEITHKAYSRTVFAEGAIMATKWIVNQNPNYYNRIK